MDDGVWSSEEEELNFGGTLGIGSASAVAGLIKSATIVEREQRSALPYQVSINHFEKRAMICLQTIFFTSTYANTSCFRLFLGN